jgi:hypothetical protein
VALSDDQKATLGLLEAEINRGRHHNRVMDAYYNGEQRLEQLGLAIPPELRRFLTIVAWPGTYVDAIEERIDLEGFVLPDATDADNDLWKIWQANNLDEESQLGHLDALIRRRAFAVVGAGDDTPDAPSAAAGDIDRDPAIPLITVESADEVAVEISPRSRRVTAAAKIYKDGTDRYATLYLPETTIWMDRGPTGWQEIDRDNHDMGVVPVVPLVNRPRLGHRGGRSQIHRVIQLTDAAARALTNAQLATEAMAIPQRWVVGASKGDFADPETGKMLATWESYFGAIWALANKDAKLGQFSAADLSNFATIVNHYATQVAGLTGLPMRYLGQNTANPPSADGIRADESRLVKACERFQQSMEGSWELTMRIARRIIDSDWDPKYQQLETQWRNPATPTLAEQADAAVKLVQTGILPVEAAWEDLGYSAARRAKLREMRAAEQAQDPIRQIADNLNPVDPTADPAQDPAADAGNG